MTLPSMRVRKSNRKYMRPRWECNKSIRGKLYGNRWNNHILPLKYPIIWRSYSRKHLRVKTGLQGGDRNVTECFKRVSAAGYFAHEARTLQINQGSSGFRCGESTRAASRCAFLNGKKGRATLWWRKPSTECRKGGLELIFEFID